MSLYELLGNKATDLLDRDEGGNGKPVDVAEDKVCFTDFPVLN